MSAFDAEAEVLTQSLSGATALLSERDMLRSKGQPSGDLVARITKARQTAEKALEKVSGMVAKSESGAALSTKETQRRRDLVRQAQTQLSKLRTQEKTQVFTATDRDALLGSRAEGGGGASADSPRPTAQDLVLKNREEIGQQDAILDAMSRGLDGLKNMGQAIGDEASLHVKLLDKLEDEVDKGNASLKRETARAEYVTQDTNTCWLYIAICVLIGLLVGQVAYWCVQAANLQSL
jgi:hypothetical protein